ncbi:MAG: nidogen-like domain-containing protein [Prosthecobacter sp.]
MRTYFAFTSVKGRPAPLHTTRGMVLILMLHALTASLLLSPCLAVDLFPSGTAAGDSVLPPSDDNFIELSLIGKGPAGSTLLIPYYDQSYNRIFINNNGVLSFSFGVGSWSTTPFPEGRNLIAPLWCDVDTRAAGGGTVWYRIEQDQADLDVINATINTQVPTAPGFRATFALIVTWDHVGYYAMQVDKLNTFQAVVASNGMHTYVMFLYPPGGINWLTGQVAGTNPQVGFDGADAVSYYSHPLSATPDVATMPAQTNTTPGIPGLLIYRADGATITAVPAAPPTPGTVTAGGSLTTWTTGTGAWTGSATTWRNGLNAIWGGLAREVVATTPVVANDLQLDATGLSFSGSASTNLQFNRLRLAASTDEVNFTGSIVLVPNAADAITQGSVRLQHSSVLVARGAGAINGGTLTLRNSARIDAYSADAITTQTAVVFDDSLGNTGGTLDLRGLGATVGTINSVGTAGLVTNSGNAAAVLDVGGSGSSDFRGRIVNGSSATSLKKSGTGTLTLYGTNTYTGRTTVTGGTLAVNGGTLGSTSSLEVQNGTASLDGTTVSTAVIVGKNLGSATLNLTNSTLTTSSFDAALEPGTNGTITMGSGTWANSGSFVLANFGSAVLTITGGSLSTPAITLGHDGGTATVALNGGVVTTGEIARWSVASSISFAGGTLRAATDSGALLNGFTAGSAVLNAGGLTIDTNARTVTIPAEFTGTGSLTKTGAGRLTLTGASTHTGPTLASAGELRVNGVMTSSPLTLAGTAQLSGSGQTGLLTMQDNSTTTPGGPGVAASFKAAGMAWNGGGLAFDLGADNATSDHLVLNGPLTGTALSKTFTFTGGTPGVIYDLITFSSTTLTAADFTATGATGVFGMSGSTLRFFVGQPADGGQHWRIKHFGLLEKSGAAADDADPDHDGLANLLEFALVQDPAASNAAAPAGKLDGGYFEFTFLRDDASEPLVALKVGVSDDLVQWTEIPVGATSSSSSGGIIITILENGPAPDAVTVQIPTDGSTNRFSRVSATSL